MLQPPDEPSSGLFPDGPAMGDGRALVLAALLLAALLALTIAFNFRFKPPRRKPVDA